MGASYFCRLRKKCDYELHQLEYNISTFLKDVRQLEEQVRHNSIDMAVYDEYVGRMIDAIEMVHNCNLKLDIRSSVHIITDDEVGSSPQRAIMPSSEGYVETHLKKSSTKIKEDSSHPKFKYEKKDISCYNTGSLLKLRVTYVDHGQNEDFLSFSAHDCQSLNDFQMLSLEDIIQYKQYSDLPQEDEVFGLLIKKSVIRAVRSSNYAFLLDFGDIVPLEDSNILYHLPKALQKAPAIAIHCQLEGIHGRSDVPPDELKQCLMNLENRTALFSVQKVINDKLHVLIVGEPKKEETQVKDNKNTNPFKTNSDFVKSEFTPEELEELLEEPLSTSNALKAVLGYVPTDEKRICRFYNSETNSCFKGANCTLSHEPLNSDGWTKDVKPASYAFANSYFYYCGSETIINITVTYVEQLEWIYAQVNDPKVGDTPMIWTSECIPDYKRLKQLPSIYDLVLAKYDDEFWYRAKVLDIDDSGFVMVFFVDYGNSQIVSLNDLAECEKELAEMFYQAVRFRLANSNPSEMTKQQRSESIDVFRRHVLNKTFDVEVVEQIGDDILIRLFE